MIIYKDFLFFKKLTNIGNDMKNIFFLIALSSSIIFLTGCETTSSIPYSASTENVLQFQSALSKSDIKVKLGDFEENTEIGELTCRLLGPIDVSRGKTRAEYIKDAMQSELFLAQAYSVDSEIMIEGRLDSLTFSSVSPASWEFGFTIYSNKSKGYSVKTKYPFNTSYSAYSSCKNVADAFGPAVQDLINTIIIHPDFNQLTGQ